MSLENDIKTFADIDDEIKRMSEELKVLRSNKGSLESTISGRMTENSIEEVSCQDDTKVKVYTKRSTPNVFKRANVHSCALKLLGESHADALVKMIEELQEVQESTGLKRMNSKKRKAPEATQEQTIE